MDPKKNPSKNKTRINGLREELARLRALSLQLEGDRIQMAVQQTDLMSHWTSMSTTYFSTMRQRDETIRQLLVDSGIPPPDKLDLASEDQLRGVALRKADKAVQTELW